MTNETQDTLGTALPKELARCQELLLQYEAIGPAGQHRLICMALKVSHLASAPGLTAYEAVCVALLKLDLAEQAISDTLKENKHLADGNNCTLRELPDALRYIKKPSGSFDSFSAIRNGMAR